MKRIDGKPKLKVLAIRKVTIIMVQAKAMPNYSIIKLQNINKLMHRKTKKLEN